MNELNYNPLTYIGRKELYTDVVEVNEFNVKRIIADLFPLHMINKDQINFLINYEAGNQPLQRKKVYRDSIDIVDIDNVAAEITNFKRSYHWGNPITLVQRGENDNGTKTEPIAITMLNECFTAENIRRKTAELSRFVEIAGVGYTYIDNNTNYREGKSPFSYVVLDPRFTFIIKSSRYPDHRPMVAVTYCVDDYGNRYFTAITDKKVFIIKNLVVTENGEPLENEIWNFGDRSGEPNPYGIINIVEWVRDVDRTGCFERQLSSLDALNILESDYANDVDQNTQAIWHGNDLDFEYDENGNLITPNDGEWVITKTNGNGKPFITPLTINYDYNGMLNNKIAKRTLILQKCNVPTKAENINGATGIATSDATGWTQAEVEATKIQGMQEDSKMQEVEVALEVIRMSSNVAKDSPLKSLRFSDVKANVKRQKTYEMTTKINAYATGVKHGLAPKALISMINLFDDPQQVAEDSKPYLDLYYATLQGKNDTESEYKPDSHRLQGDNSDQVDNSPNIDGIQTK